MSEFNTISNIKKINLKEQFARKKVKLVSIAIIFGLVMAVLVQATGAGTITASAFAVDQKNCTSNKGTRVVENEGDMKSTVTCQFSKGRFRPTKYKFDGQTGDWEAVLKNMKSKGAAEAETCVIVKAIGGNATIDIHALGYTNADKRNVSIDDTSYEPYCLTASLTKSENQNSGFTVKSGTLRVSVITVSAKQKEVAPPPVVEITICRDGSEVVIDESTRLNTDTDPPCVVIENPTYIDVCRDGGVVTIEESTRRSTDTNTPCNTPVDLIDVCRNGVLVTIDSEDIQSNDTDPPCNEPDPVILPPTSGNSPWTLPAGSNVKVDLPNGLLTHESTEFVSASTIATTEVNGKGLTYWKVNRSWDERTEGKAIDFGSRQVQLSGQTVRGFKITVPSGMSSLHLFDGRGTVSYGVINNQSQKAHNSIFHDSVNGNHYSLLGNVGDVLKPADGGVMTHTDAYWENNVLPGGPNDKHYDGMQAHSNGFAKMERIVIDWKNAGTIANTTAAIFTQQQGGVTFGDILILNPGGTFQIIRLSGSGTHSTTGPVQVIGTQEKNNNFDKQAPTHIIKLTNGMNKNSITLYNDVPGASDFLIQ